MESIEKLGERLEAMEHRGRMMERRLRRWRVLACGLLMLGLVILPLVGGTAQDESSEYRGIRKRLAALEYKLQYITGGVNEVVITGANLRIVNGLDNTETTNGLGNLIVGYNEPRNNPALPPDKRTGSHNVVVGAQNNFSSFGGLVIGQFNEISGDFASVSGGLNNTASGRFSSVSGGASNTASNFFSSVSGGINNTASGEVSSVSGGRENIASGVASSVSGGTVNQASGLEASVSGGQQNTASGSAASVSGGFDRVAPNQFNWAAGPLFAAQ
jgi:hypothetical protein